VWITLKTKPIPVPLSPDELTRFLGLVPTESDPTDCWEWMGTRSQSGYGVFFIRGRSYMAHRVMHSIFIGELEDGDFVLHACDNPACVNLFHIRKGTAKDNTADAQAWRTGERRSRW